MMDLGYKPQRTLSTLDLPYVQCDPPLEFEINNAVTFDFNLDMQRWAMDDGADDDLAIRLGAQLLKSVTSSTGETYKLGNSDTIGELIKSTSFEFLKSVLKGWVMLIAIERTAMQKKMMKYGKPSIITKPKNGQAVR